MLPFDHAPFHPRLEIDGFRAYDGIVDRFRPLSDVHPVVKTSDAGMGFERVMIALTNDLDRFGERAEDVCGTWRPEASMNGGTHHLRRGLQKRSCLGGGSLGRRRRG